METLFGLAIVLFFFSVVIFFLDIFFAAEAVFADTAPSWHRKIGMWGMVIASLIIAPLFLMGYRAW